MIIACCGLFLKIEPQQKNNDNNDNDAAGVLVSWYRYSHELNQVQPIPNHSFIVEGHKHTNKSSNGEVTVLAAACVSDRLLGLHMPYILLREAVPEEEVFVYTFIRINFHRFQHHIHLHRDVSELSTNVSSSSSEYDVMYQFKKDSTYDEEWTIMDGPTYVVAAHAHTKKHAKILVSLSTVAPTASPDNAWGVFDTEVPDPHLRPALLAYYYDPHTTQDEIVAILRVRGGGKASGNSEWEFRTVSLCGVRPEGPPPPSPDLLAEETEEDEDSTMVSAATFNVVDIIHNVLPQDCEHIQDICTMAFYEREPPLCNADGVSLPHHHACAIGINTNKMSGKLLEYYAGELAWFDGIVKPPKSVNVVQHVDDFFYVVHDFASNVQLFDSHKKFLSEHTAVDNVLIDDFAELGFSQLALVGTKSTGDVDIQILDPITGRSLLKDRPPQGGSKSAPSQSSNIISVCQALRDRANHAMAHLQEIKKTMQQKDMLLAHAYALLKSLTLPQNSSPTTTVLPPTPFLETNDVVPLFTGTDALTPSKSKIMEPSTPLRVDAIRQLFGNHGEWELVLTITNIGSAPIMCLSVFIVSQNFALMSEMAISNNACVVQSGQSSSFLVHTTLPPITEKLCLDLIIEYESECLNFVSKIEITPDFKSLEAAVQPLSPATNTVIQPVQAEVLLFNSRVKLDASKMQAIFSEIASVEHLKDDDILSFSSLPSSKYSVKIEVDCKGGANLIPIRISSPHFSHVLAALRILSSSLQSNTLIMPNYVTTQSMDTVNSFITSFQKEIGAVLSELENIINHNTNTKPTELPMGQLKVDSDFAVLLVQFNYLFSAKREN